MRVAPDPFAPVLGTIELEPETIDSTEARRQGAVIRPGGYTYDFGYQCRLDVHDLLAREPVPVR
jgi:hypothetical protein